MNTPPAHQWIAAKLLVLMLLSPTTSVSQTPISLDELSRLARKADVAWRCQLFASLSRPEGDGEGDRLFQVGYEAAKKYHQGRRGNKAIDARFLMKIPVSMWPSEGPTAEFAAGATFGKINENTMNDITKEILSYIDDNDSEEIKEKKMDIAKKKYTSGEYDSNYCHAVR